MGGREFVEDLLHGHTMDFCLRADDDRLLEGNLFSACLIKNKASLLA
jgi:hypothetical protein